MQLELTAIEIRILGALIEKQLSTPEYYPLTLHALGAACNQKSNRDPVMSLSEEEVSRGLSSLQYDRRLVATYSGAGSRVVKYSHRLDETLGVDEPELALLCELMLRGPQTPGELRGRASRLRPFASPAEVKAVLDGLKNRQPDPYVAEIPRPPGCKENRYAHSLGGTPEPGWDAETLAASRPSPAPPTAVPPPEDLRFRALEERIERLEARMEAWEGPTS